MRLRLLLFVLALGGCATPRGVHHHDVADSIRDTATTDAPMPMAEANSPPLGPDVTLNEVAPPLVTDSETKDAAGGVGFDGDGDAVPDAISNDSSSTPPAFPHFNAVIDLHRGTVPVWATMITVSDGAGGPSFTRVHYKDTGDRHDFWPASTIKLYTATAALVLINSLGVSLDASVTFYRQTDGQWVEDITRTVREMISGAIPCSSNEDYTLLLRFAGLDWLNQTFFSPGNGFTRTALMQGYVSSRPHYYKRDEPQRLLITEGGITLTREHTWSGTSYAAKAGCTVANGGGTANCSPTSDMAEHLRRLFFHAQIPASERFSIRESDLDWYRHGDDATRILNSQCTGGGWPGVKNVLPGASYYHKTGSISNTKLDVAYVDAPLQSTRFILALATESTETTTREKLFEELARLALTPGYYVHLAPLKDHVNPVVADLTIYSETSAELSLITKPYATDGYDLTGWGSLAGTTISIAPGLSQLQLTSSCVSASETRHVRGQLRAGSITALSDLHFVIVDGQLSCP